MQMTMTLSGVPTFTSTSSSGLNMAVGFDMAFSVDSQQDAFVLPGVPTPTLRGVRGSLAGATPVFTLNASASVAMEITVRNGSAVNGTVSGPVVAMDVSSLALNLGEQSSNVGPIQLGALKLLVGVLAPLLKSAINSLMGGGIALPGLDGFEFVSPEVVYGDGYIIMDTDIHIGSITE